METPARSASDRPRLRAAAIVTTIVATLVASGAAATAPPVRLSPPPVTLSTVRPLPALERHAEELREGLAALEAGDGVTASQRLSSFNYGERPVEQARLLWLALAEEMNHETTAARRSLAKLRARGASIASRDAALAKLASIYSDGGFWSEAADVFSELRSTARGAAEARSAAESELTARLALGDPGALLARARAIASQFPRDERAPTALAVAASITGAVEPLDALTDEERVDRAWERVRLGDVPGATTELDALGARELSRRLRARIELTRAFILRKSGEPAAAMKLARSLPLDDPALRAHALEIEADSAQALLAAAEAASWRTYTVKERVGTKRVRVKGRWTTRTIYRSVTKKAKKTDARTRRQIAAAHAAATVALERFLEAQDDPAKRKTALRSLASIARDAKDRDGLETRIVALVALDPREDYLLQDEWNDAWLAWRAKKIPLARERFGLIQRAYALPAARRQARYWYARCLERSGEPAEAKRIYDELASVTHDDVYAIFARSRGGSPAAPAPPPVAPEAGDPPPELTLAWELAQLGLGGESRTEVRAAQSDGNRRWAYAILAESHRRDGAQLLMANAIRRGFPEIGSVDEALVPVRYLDMYYASPHRDLLEKSATTQGLEPALVMGLVLQESSGDATAGSRVGARGLMQLMPSTAAEVSRKAGIAFHESRLTEPELNVELGTRYLRELLGMMNGDEILALASYNAGFGNVQRWLRATRGAGSDEFLESIPYAETRGYVKRVLYYRSVYRDGKAGG
ncbi:MAG: lytic transglycosylase domain-containing protein [Thermoanaerobaculia bacterium]|jgi:soluble lytic murein transglycosylase